MSADDLRRELLAMAELDVQVRAELAAEGTLFDGYHPRMQAVHDAHATRLAAILDAHGWPGESLVGHDGADAAWLIVQHAIAQPALQRRALVILQEAVARGQAVARQAAMLEDRIRTFEGLPQRYGTQMDWDAQGELSPLPIDDPEGVDQLRRSVGLGPLAHELETHRRRAAGHERPPADWSARQRERDVWLRSVGWRT
ncbi:MAG TPA: DUF6624 domain-containing protein [Gemmatimonadales bacterium]|nr:DUF6624 domain-containing protein [Gemmatimonadales bacterium]